MSEVQKSTTEQLEKADRLIRESNLLRLRGQSAEADRLLDEAVKTAPDSAVVQEAFGDNLVLRRKRKEAMAAFKAALVADPGNIRLETKYAEAIVAVDLAENLAMDQAVDSSTFAAGWAAVFLSLVLPGLGHWVLVQRQKAVIIFAVWLIGIVGTLADSGALPSLGRTLGLTAGPDLKPWVLITLPLWIGSWLYAILDSKSESKRMTPSKIEHPIPLVDKDHEL